MPFDTFTPELALFLCLVQVLSSLPTDPYYNPWREEPPAHRIQHHPHGSHNPHYLGAFVPQMDGRVFPAFPQSNLTQTPDPYYPYPFDQRGGYPSQDDRREFPVLDQRGYAGRGEVFQPRSLEEVPAEGYLSAGDSQNFGKTYSSHVKYGGEAGSRERRVEKTRKNVRASTEPGLGSEGPGRVDERINFEEASRSMRSGSSKEAEVANPRIVTPKGGRRPPHGSSAKNENKPLNAISTTEKAVGSQPPKGSKRPRPGGSKPPGGDIVFPDGYQKKFVPRVSKCAKKSTFCEHLGEEYPGEYINQVLKKEGAMFREFFGKDVISDPNITERINAPEENSLCPYRQEVVFPRAAQNKEDKWLFIVNQDQYVQGVTVEVCLNPESRCILTEGFPLGYTPYCKQKYIERRLVAIGEDGKPHSDSFRLPSCCSCVVKHETSARMAAVRLSRDVSPAP